MISWILAALMWIISDKDKSDLHKMKMEREKNERERKNLIASLKNNMKY